MNRFLKLLTGYLGYLGRGATPIDGMYFNDRSEPATAVNGAASCSTAALVEKKFRAGYRVLM